MATSGVTLPMTLEALVGYDEPGNEAQFCPVLGLPLKRTHRVRTLPGFHLMSLDAGKEAMAQGSYEAFSQRFKCEGLEHLHPEDRVFVCPQDNKAFLNQMSMRYHQYIRHELEERKVERKRLQQRAEERRARGERRPEATLRPVPATMPPATTPSTPITPTPAGDRTKETLEVSTMPVSEVRRSGPPVSVPKRKNAESADPRLSQAPLPTPPAVPPASKAVAPAESMVPEEDLYGNIGDDDAKKQKTGSSYASAMTAMLKGDFDEDEF